MITYAMLYKKESNETVYHCEDHKIDMTPSPTIEAGYKVTVITRTAGRTIIDGPTASNGLV